MLSLPDQLRNAAQKLSKSAATIFAAEESALILKKPAQSTGTMGDGAARAVSAAVIRRI
jgi:hypothetical protein